MVSNSLKFAQQISRKLHRSFRRGISSTDISRSLIRALRAEDSPPCNVDELARRLTAEPSEIGTVIDDLLSDRASAFQQFSRLLPALMQFDHVPQVLSLGTHCFTSSLLQRWGLRRWSGPFDWIFSSVPMITHCIKDDFSAFLDRDQYLPVALENRRDGPTVNRVDHALYLRQFGVQRVFNHHDVNLDADYSYLVRCVNRFRDVLKSPEPKVFVVARPHGRGSLTELQSLRDALEPRCNNFSLVCFEVNTTADTPTEVTRLESILVEESLHVAAFIPVSTWEPLRFLDPLDEHTMSRHVIKLAMTMSR